MPYSYVTYTGNGSTTQFALTFPYIRKEHVYVSVNYVNQSYTWVNDSTVQLASAPANNTLVQVRRVTPVNLPLVDFTDGSTLVAADLDTNALQQTYINQEQEDQLKQAIYVDPNGSLTASNQRLKNLLDPIDAQDASTKNYVDTRDALKVSKTGDSMTGALAMGANKVTGVADPTAAQDAATKNYVDTNDALRVSKAGDSMTGALAMGNNKITGLGTPTLSTDAATKDYVDTYDNLKVNRAGDSMNGPIDMGSYKITSTYTPSSGPDLTNKTYVDSVVNNGVPTGDKGDITVTNFGATWTVDNGVITPAKLSTGGPSWNVSGGLGVNNSSPILAEGLSFTDTLPSSFGGANRISFGQSFGIVRNGIGVSGASPNTAVSYIADSNHAFYNYLSGTLQQVAQLDKRLMLGGPGTYSFAGTTRLVVQGNSVDNTTEGIIDLIRGSNASTGNVLGRIQFRDNYATPQSYYASIGCVAEAGPSPTNYLGALTFSTNTTGSATPLERMRITQAGYLLHGCTSVPSNTVKGFSISPDLVSIDHHRSSSGNQTSNMTHIGFYNGNGIVGSITTNGSATAYGTSSDYRLKENVEPLQDSIVRFQQLKPSRFNFIADPSVVVDGFIAHEVQEVVPEAISGEKDAVDENGSPIYQSIDQSKLVPLLTAALQEAIGEIESLKARVAALEAA